jgi:hypothetical protein
MVLLTYSHLHSHLVLLERPTGIEPDADRYAMGLTTGVRTVDRGVVPGQAQPVTCGADRSGVASTRVFLSF